MRPAIIVRGGMTEFIKANAVVILAVLILFTSGTLFGALSVRALSADQIGEMVEYLQVFLRGLARGTEGAAGPEILSLSVANNIKTVGLLWLMGLTVIGIPVIALVMFFRGFIIGFTVGFFVRELGYKGILFSLFAVLPHNLLAVPAILTSGVVALAFSAAILRGRRGGGRRYPFGEMAAYTIAIGVMAAGLLGASLVEAYITPVFIRILGPYLLS